MFKFLKYSVSQGRNRYVDEKYDLDLSYITPRVVAMGLPSSGMSSFWRNDIDEVSSFLHEKHAGDYMIWKYEHLIFTLVLVPLNMTTQSSKIKLYDLSFLLFLVTVWLARSSQSTFPIAASNCKYNSFLVVC
jgi:hypothetical protein